MKLKDIKRILNKLTPEQLEQELLYNSNDLSVSGIARLTRAKCNLYNTYDDDPCRLKTIKELKTEYDNEEIEEFDIEIPKNAFVIEF